MLRRERSALLVLTGIAIFASFVPTPRFETSFFLVGLASCVLFGDVRTRRSLTDTRLARWACVYTPIVILGVIVTEPAWGAARPFVGLDGRVNEAIVGELIDQAARGRPLTWLTRIAPGDPTLDLYPTLAHRGIALLARVIGAQHQTARLLVSIASAAYVAVAVGIARCAVRVGAPLPAALVVAVLALLDVGTDFTWGTQPVFRYAFLPSTLSIAALLHTLPSLFDLARRRTRARLFAATMGIAITAALHPLALTVCVLLAIVIALSIGLGRPHARRALLAPLGVIMLGLASSAWLWMPAAARVLAYGVHYGTPQIPGDLALGRISVGALPDGGWMILVASAWMAGLCALLRRDRPEARVLVWVSIALVLSYVEAPMIELGLAPSTASVRWQAFRIGAIVKPLFYVLGALAMGSGARLHVLAVARPSRERLLRALGGLAIVALAILEHDSWAAGLRDLARERTSDYVGPTATAPEDVAALRYRLERERAERTGGRLLMVCGLECTYELFVLARDGADGTPGIELALSQPAPAGFLLRDQLRTITDENLARFGIRWAVAPSREILPGTDASADQRFGRLWLRPVPGWDGSFAHVTRGEGRVIATTVPGEGFDLTLESTSEPALIELGTPWYPRLVAHDDRGELRVWAMPVGAPGANDPNPTFEHASALWLRPGTTRVRADGALPSDGVGTIPTALAGIAVLLLALPAWRDRRRALGARVHRAIARSHLVFVTVGLLGIALVILVVRLRSGPADAVRFAALLPTASVFVVGAEGQSSCMPERLGRVFHCPDGAILRTHVSYTLNDWHVGWPVPAPALELTQARPRSRYVIELVGQSLEGTYYGQCEGCLATLRDAEGQSQARIEEPTQRLSVYVDAPQIELRALEPRASFTLVASRLLDPSEEPPRPPAAP